MTGIILVRVNCASRAEAEAIAAAALERRLAAAANIHPAIDSLYRWEGEVRSATEVPLDLKTRTGLFGPLSEMIAALHSYETPSILAFEASGAAAAYRSWLEAETDP